jgi:RHS repeat-associated protein
LDHLASVTIPNQDRRVDFTYDANGRRVEKRVYGWFGGGSWTLTDTRRYAWDGDAITAEFDGENHLLTSYTWGIGGPAGGVLAVTDHRDAENVKTYRVISDATGSVVGLVHGLTGQVAATYRYDPYGNLVAAEGPAADVCSYRFAGMFYQAEAGLNSAVKRDEINGVWLSRDPIAEQGGVNLYPYCAGDPVNATDAIGLAPYWEAEYHPSGPESYEDAAYHAALIKVRSKVGFYDFYKDYSLADLNEMYSRPKGDTQELYKMYVNDLLLYRLPGHPELVGPEWPARLRRPPQMYADDRSEAERARAAELYRIDQLQREAAKYNEVLAHRLQIEDANRGPDGRVNYLGCLWDGLCDEAPNVIQGLAALGAKGQVAQRISRGRPGPDGVSRPSNGGVSSANGNSVAATGIGPEHHLMTNKNSISAAAGGPYTPKFEELAARRGITLDHEMNKLRLPGHQGPHPEYNRVTYTRLSVATENLSGEEFNQAFDRALAARGRSRFGPNQPTVFPRISRVEISKTDFCHGLLERIRIETATPGTELNRLATGGKQ